MTKLKSPATRGIVARLEDALGPLRASVTESLDGVARRLLREAKNLRAERDELIGKRHVEIERAAAAEQRAEAAEKDRDLANAALKLACDTGRGDTIKLVAAEQRNRELEGALRSFVAAYNNALQEDGERIRKKGREAGLGYTPVYEAFVAARAALHDEERSAPPPEEKTPTCLNCGKKIATGWVLVQMNDGRLGVLCEQCRPDSSRAKSRAAAPEAPTGKAAYEPTDDELHEGAMEGCVDTYGTHDED